MRLLIQRVRRASVQINNETIASIGHGLLVFVGVSQSDHKPRPHSILPRRYPT